MPVPRRAIDRDLAVFDALEGVERQQREADGEQPNDEVERVGPGDHVKEVAVWVGRIEETLCIKLLPGDPLAGDE